MRRLKKLFYSSEDWNLMQRAHLRASKQLQRCPKSHENADRLARRASLKVTSTNRAAATACFRCEMARLLASTSPPMKIRFWIGPKVPRIDRQVH